VRFSQKRQDGFVPIFAEKCDKKRTEKKTKNYEDIKINHSVNQ